MTRILLTGATGFLGQHLARGLHAEGHHLRALVRNPDRLQPIAQLVHETAVGDLTRPDSLRDAVQDIDVIVHAACAVQGTFDSAQDAARAFQAVNVDGTRNLLDALDPARLPRLVHVSSTAAVGPPPAGEMDETVPCRPAAPYQRSKRAAEELVLAYRERHPLQTVILRPCVIAGEGKPRGELLTLLRLVRRGLFPAIGNARAARKPMVLVDDVVQAVARATTANLDAIPQEERIFFITSGAPHTLGDILDAAGRVMDVRRTHLPIPLPIARIAAAALELGASARPHWNPPLTRDRIRLLIADRFLRIDRARRHLGYAPSCTDPEIMLRRTADWHRAHGDL